MEKKNYLMPCLRTITLFKISYATISCRCHNNTVLECIINFVLSEKSKNLNLKLRINQRSRDRVTTSKV